MAAPNIVNVTTITGRSNGALLTTTSNTVVTNPASSNKVFKVNTIVVSNIDATANAAVNVGYFDSSGSSTFNLSTLITIPTGSSLDLLNKPIYLEEGDFINGSANVNCHMVVSFEELS